MSGARVRVPVLSLRMARERSIDLPREWVRSADHAASVASCLIGDLPTERLVAILVDGGSRVTGVAVLAQGGMHGCGVRVPDVLRAVLAGHAAAFVLAHNHPSGDPTPSAEDVALTEAVWRASRVVGLDLLDHVVVARGGDFRTIPLPEGP